MAIPFFKEIRIGGYLIKQKMLGQSYPLVLMLELLFRCNLACVGCGKIDYPTRSSIAACRRRNAGCQDECGAPMVAIPGGEPLIHKEIGEIVRGLVARKKFVSLCTNALLLEKKLDLFEPSPYLFFSVHLDGLKDHHDKAVSQKGVFDRAVSAIKAAKAKGFTVNVNATIFDGHAAEDTPNSSTSRRNSASAFQCRRATPMSARRPGALPQPHQDQEAVPRRLLRSARARTGISCIPACS
jgi:hopanoid biosynthesis associated radical SAM protein HpnH